MPYIKNIVAPFVEAGYKVGVLHSRGINKTPLLTERLHYHGIMEDFREGVETITARHKSKDIHFYGLGTSLGANTIIKYAGVSGEDCRFRGILSISNPYNIRTSLDHVKSLY